LWAYIIVIAGIALVVLTVIFFFRNFVSGYRDINNIFVQTIVILLTITTLLCAIYSIAGGYSINEIKAELNAGNYLSQTDIAFLKNQLASTTRLTILSFSLECISFIANHLTYIIVMKRKSRNDKINREKKFLWDLQKK
jgi:hypothetical protein